MTTEHLTENDVTLLRAANAELAAAQNVASFVQAHISRVYQLRAGDVVTNDGRIERAPRD